ncbi:MAG: FixH family protein [Gammaproteobacteria bacterium]
MSTEPDKVTRWYSEPYAWMVFGIPAFTVVAGIAMVLIASSNTDGLVVDDYYKQGLEINRVLDREARAAELGLALTVERLSPTDFSISLGATPESAAALPDRLDINFAHATRAAGDQMASASHMGGGHYRGRLERLSQGPWYVDVSTADWRLIKRVVVGADGSKI